jgi:hypothetical protein
MKREMERMKCIIIFISCVLLIGCSGRHEESTQDNTGPYSYTLDGAAWRNPAPDSFYSPDAQDGKYSIEFHEVVTHEAEGAVYWLLKVPYEEIDKKTAKRLTGVDIKVPAGKKLYLLRAAYHPSGTGDYEVRKIGDSVLVLYSCLGHSDSSERSAVVVALDKKPSVVFVDIHVVE